MKKFLNVFVSIIIVFVIIGLEFAIGTLYSLKSVLDVDSISNAVQDVNVDSLIYEGEKLTELGETVNETFKELGLNLEESDKMLNTPKFKKVMGDFFGSVIISSVDDTVEVIYPSKEDIKDIVDECYDIAKENHELELSKEETLKLTDDIYDDFIKSLEEIATDMKSEMEGD